MILSSRAIIILVYLCPALSFAATLDVVNISEHGGRYTLHIQAKIKAHANSIKQIIVDYENLTSINPYLKESKVISSLKDKRTTVNMLTKACLLFICYNIRHVQTFQLIDEHTIYSRILPKPSDFKQGWSRWIIKEDKSDVKNVTTQLSLDSEMTPDFFILPLIGSHHLKNKIIEIAIETINNLENEAKKTDKQNSVKHH